MRDLEESLKNSWHNVRGASIREMEEGEREALLRYGDIIDLPHHESRTRPHQSMALRAAQFAPFAALTGYGDAIRETARRTETRPELEEDKKEELDRKLAELLQSESRTALLTVFVPDEKKEGGRIEKRVVTAAGILPQKRILLTEGEDRIPISDILDMEPAPEDG